MNKGGKRLWGKRGHFFWGNQFQKKIELGDAQSSEMPPPLGTPEHYALVKSCSAQTSSDHQLYYIFALLLHHPNPIPLGD
jgi:hypothetical protein